MHQFFNTQFKDAMEANSLNNFHLVTPGWSGSSPKSNDRDANTLPIVPLLEAFLCDVGRDTPTVQPALPRCFAQPKPDQDVNKLPVNTNIPNSH